MSVIADKLLTQIFVKMTDKPGDSFCGCWCTPASQKCCSNVLNLVNYNLGKGFHPSLIMWCLRAGRIFSAVYWLAWRRKTSLRFPASSRFVWALFCVFFFFLKENDELGGWKRQLNLFKMIFLMKVSSRGIVGQVDSNRFRKTEPVIWLFCTFSKSKGLKFWVAGKKPRFVLLWNKWLIVSLIFTPLVHHSTLILSSVIARSRLNLESRAASTAPSWRDSQVKKKKSQNP